jgi:hypothetical protein
MPAVDIAEALGCSRKNITEVIKNNPHLFKGVSITSPLDTEGGTQKATFLNIFGVIGVLMRAHPSGSKTENGKKKIELFQAWARDVLTREIQGPRGFPVPGQASQAPGGWAAEAEQHLRFARAISRELNVPENWCLTIALQQIEKDSGISMKQYRKLILPIQAPGPGSPGEIQAPAAIEAGPGPGLVAAAGVAPPVLDPAAAAPPGDLFITVSQIAGIVRMRAEEINRYLERNGYQVRDDSGQYLLTDKGAKFGRVFPYGARSGHIGEFIKWDRAVIRDSKMIENRPLRIPEN